MSGTSAGQRFDGSGTINHQVLDPQVVDRQVSGLPAVDIHVHFGSPRDEASGCYWSEAFERTSAYAAMLLLTKNLFKKISFATVHKHLTGVVQESRFVAQSVFLAMDQVYDAQGKHRPEWTHLHVPNRCIAGIAAENPRVLFGASVHPCRPDWKEALDESLQRGAVLCKWIPSAQRIDFGETRRLERFYQKLADHHLPLLCHAGPEYSIPSSFSDVEAHHANNPANLRTALANGVTVVVAHCALPYFGIFDRPYEDDFRTFLSLFNESASRGWNLYADLSALTGFFRLPYVRDEILRLPHDRLLMGSDYPIPMSELCHSRRTDFFSWLRFVHRVMRLKNPLDKNFLLTGDMGFSPCVFTNAWTLFQSIRRPV